MRKTDVVSWRHTHAAANSSRKRRNASAARTGTSRGRRRGRRRPIRVAQARRRGCGREVRRCAKQTWRDEPQGTTRVSACALRCNVRAEHHGRLEYHPAWSHTWDIRNAHITSECAHPTVRLACAFAHACLCSRPCVVRERGSNNRALREGWLGTRRSRNGCGPLHCERCTLPVARRMPTGVFQRKRRFGVRPVAC